MQAIEYIVNGLPPSKSIPNQGKDSLDEEAAQDPKDLTSTNENTLSSTSISRAGKPSRLKKKNSLMRHDSSSSGTWSKILKSIKKFFELTYYEKPVDPHRYRITPRVMLYGCNTNGEHYDHIAKIQQTARGRFGLEGLEACGFTYKLVSYDENAASGAEVSYPRDASWSHCACDRRLVHTSTGTLITKNNLKTFIADGEMYEAIVRLCQEYAQDLMREEGSLHWVSVCEDVKKGKPIRILVDRSYPIHGKSCRGLDNDSIHETIQMQRENEQEEISARANRDVDSDIEASRDVETLLITTGKGKVRAGIFSRQHLLISGIESSTALPIIRDAKRRNMSVAVLDPNARGDRYGMSTYEQSMKVLFGSASPQNNSTLQRSQSHIGTGPIYILAHSASGSQLTRYLQTEGQHILPRIKSIAFTDSNHSIQWLKNHGQISSFFQSPSTIYIRSSNQMRDDDWEKHKCGEECKTDDHWKHRFGEIFTVWAGTTDHSLTNFTSQEQIWAHFDKCRQYPEGAKKNDDSSTLDSVGCSTCIGILDGNASDS